VVPNGGGIAKRYSWTTENVRLISRSQTVIKGFPTRPKTGLVPRSSSVFYEWRRLAISTPHTTDSIVSAGNRSASEKSATNAGGMRRNSAHRIGVRNLSGRECAGGFEVNDESKRVPTVMSVEQCILGGGKAMPLPHFPSDEPDEEDAPDLNDVVDRILNGGDDPSPTPTGV
jgi:hypothetical protein